MARPHSRSSDLANTVAKSVSGPSRRQRLYADSGPNWWPSELGTPTSSGAQNDLRYAYFPVARCLAINQHGRITIHDTGEHRISGVSQQQGGGQSVTFSSQHGVVRLADLPLLTLKSRERTSELPEATSPAAQHLTTTAVGSDLRADKQDRVGMPPDDIVAMIERLAELRRKNVLTEEEFSSKRAELLSRL